MKKKIAQNMNDFFYGPAYTPSSFSWKRVGEVSLCLFMVAGLWLAFIGVYGIFKAALFLL